MNRGAQYINQSDVDEMQNGVVWSGHSCPLACSTTKLAGSDARATILAASKR